MFWAGFAAGTGFTLVVVIAGGAYLVVHQMHEQRRVASETRNMIAENVREGWERAAREAAARRK